MDPHWNTPHYYNHIHQQLPPLINNPPDQTPLHNQQHQNPPYSSTPEGSNLLQQQLKTFWNNQNLESKQAIDFKNHSLPLARIKKIMKSDDNVHMISSDAPILLARACEMFIQDLTLRSWNSTEETKRKTLQKADISAALSTTDLFDFLVDIVPREKPVISNVMPIYPSRFSSMGLQQLEGYNPLGEGTGVNMGLQQIQHDDQVDHGGVNVSKYYVQGGWPTFMSNQSAWPPPDL